MYFITYVDRVNVSTAAIVFGKEFSLSNTQVGFVFSAFAYPYLLFQVIGGWVGDQFWTTPHVARLLHYLGRCNRTYRFGDGAGVAGDRSHVARTWAKAPPFRPQRAQCPIGQLPASAASAQGITHAFARSKQRGDAADCHVADDRQSAGAVRSSFSACSVSCGRSSWAWYFRDNPRDHARITQEELKQLPEYVGVKQAPAVPCGPH